MSLSAWVSDVHSAEQGSPQLDAFKSTNNGDVEGVTSSSLFLLSMGDWASLDTLSPLDPEIHMRSETPSASFIPDPPTRSTTRRRHAQDEMEFGYTYQHVRQGIQIDCGASPIRSRNQIDSQNPEMEGSQRCTLEGKEDGDNTDTLAIWFSSVLAGYSPVRYSQRDQQDKSPHDHASNCCGQILRLAKPSVTEQQHTCGNELCVE